jgi:hypothetical protein
MTEDLTGYFELAAQVIPVLLLALVIESGFLPQLRAEVAAIREMKSQVLSVANPTDHPTKGVVADVVTGVVIASVGVPGELLRVVTYVQESPRARSVLGVLAIDATVIGAVVCEGIALACVVFDMPRCWQEALALVVLAGLTALLVLTLFALRRLTVARVKADKDDGPDNSAG